jgi:CHAT domain-containing protein
MPGGHADQRTFAQGSASERRPPIGDLHGGAAGAGGLPRRQPGRPGGEAEAIRAALGKAKTLSGRRATPEGVRRAWQGARYAHLNTHADARPDDPMRSRLLLANDAELTVRDLLSQPRPLEARLVALSSCGSAVTSGRQGVDEIVSFRAALLRAGAAQVLASAWPVLDAATVPLMAGFYERLGQDEDADLAEALLASARAVRAGGTAALPEAAARPARFWRRWMGRSGAVTVSAGAMRQRGAYRMKLAPEDEALAAEPPADPDLAPANWNPPFFWAGFAVHGNTDTVGN